MGKKSKKKGGGGNAKAARKEKLQGRREQHMEELDRHRSSREREYFVGDRVWFYKTREHSFVGNPDTYRGIVKSVEEGALEIVPFQSTIDGSNTSVRALLYDVFPDFCDFTLRFDAGEEVLCSMGADGRTPKTITALWPIEEIYLQGLPVPSAPGKTPPAYRCEEIFAPNDNDDCILLHPSSFRFDVGDDVVFDTELAQAPGKSIAQLRNASPWLRGMVSAVDITGMDFYAVYKCSFDSAGRQYSCWIPKDDDEHIARPDADPRGRLLEAIEQDVSQYHLNYLVNHYKIDVSIFRELVIAKALKNASYRALSWLQHDMKVDVLRIKDDKGNNFLHLIASSSRAASFFREAGRVASMNELPDWQLDITSYDLELTSALNADGETWLQVLVRRGDEKALDVALSPNSGLAWRLRYDFRLPSAMLTLLKDAIDEAGSTKMRFMFNAFMEFRERNQVLSGIEAHSTSTGEADLLQKDYMAIFAGKDASHYAKLHARFFLDWQNHLSNQLSRNPFVHLVKNGFSQLFSVFCDADDSLFLNESYRVQSNEDRGEYIQPELTPEQEEYASYECISGDIFLACIIGDEGLRSYKPVDRHEKNYFFRCLRQHATKCDAADCPSWLAHLKGMGFYYESNNRQKDFWKDRVRLLEDHATIEGRARILDHLLERQPNAKLDVLEAIRHRQCGILRFLVGKGLVQLSANASANRMLAKHAAKLQFMERGRIPPTMSTKTFLCFCAIQFDDLQSLQWLCGSSSTPTTEVCDGWNLLHLAAYLGRIEIIAWLYSTPAWLALSTEVCGRKPLQNARAVHLAASEGHIIAVELMRALKVGVEDKKGKLPVHYAKKSRHNFVKEWVAEKEKSSNLARNVQKLLKLAHAIDTTADQLKGFIESSKCLDARVWEDCEYERHDITGPLGYSLGELLHECCAHFPEQEFVLWICSRSYFSDAGESEFWGTTNGTKVLRRDDLLSFATSEGYSDLIEYLSRPWLKDISCIDPLERNLLLKTSLGGHPLLTKTRAEMLRAVVLCDVASACDDKFMVVIRQGGHPDELEQLLRIKTAAKRCLVEAGFAECGYEYGGQRIDECLRPIDAKKYIFCDYGLNRHPVTKQLAFSGRRDLSEAYIVLATEGSSDLLDFALRKLAGWTARMELDVVRIAAFFNHFAILDIFLGDTRKDLKLLSDSNDRVREAILGAGESCRHRELAHLLKKYPFVCNRIKEGEVVPELDECSQQRRAYVETSLICLVLNGYAQEGFDRSTDTVKDLRALRVLVDQLQYTNEDILDATKLLLNIGHSVKWARIIVDLLQNIVGALDLQPSMHHEKMHSVCGDIVQECERQFMWRKNTTDLEDDAKRILQWLGKMADSGISIQTLAREERTYRETQANSFVDGYRILEQHQLLRWSRFSTIKNSGSLDEIMSMVDQGVLSLDARDRGGLNLAHLSAAYDRIDVLEWLIVTKGMDIDSKDGKGRSVLKVARASKAASTTKWIEERRAKRIVAAFVQRNCRHMIAVRKRERLTNAATIIQTRYRGHLVRKLHAGVIFHRLEEAQRFAAVWGGLFRSCRDLHQRSWSSLRENTLDIKQVGMVYDEGYFEDIDAKLTKALEEALRVKDEEDGVSCSNQGEESLVHDVPKEDVDDETGTFEGNWLSFQVTSHVVKFLQKGDKKYRGFFVRRMQQLANGERSRILQKRLKGSRTTIYETYLEQKSGFRILWTEEGDTIVVWFVAKHKEVSRLMSLIDDSKSRAARQRVPEKIVADLQNEHMLPQTQPKEVLLDVYGNVPLKLYDMSYHSLSDLELESWTPALHLTDEERCIVESEGTVLVLGRSGTGKTVCICNRIEYDRQRYGQDPTFTQLFVARSTRLCKYVAQSVTTTSSFRTFDELLRDIDQHLPRLEGNDNFFPPSQRVNFQQYKQQFHIAESGEASALTVWTVIRTFLKGSIEAFQSSGVLPRDSFTATEKLGKNRCRIPAHLRGSIYDAFERYEKTKAALGLGIVGRVR